MDKLTTWKGGRPALRVCSRCEEESGCSSPCVQEAIKRLAQYESSGLAPHEVSAAAILSKGGEIPEGMDPERLEEAFRLLVLSEGGRLIEIPAEIVYELTWDAGPECDMACEHEDCSECEKGRLFVYERKCRQEHLKRIGKTVFVVREDAIAAAKKTGRYCEE